MSIHVLIRDADQAVDCISWDGPFPEPLPAGFSQVVSEQDLYGGEIHKGDGRFELPPEALDRMLKRQRAAITAARDGHIDGGMTFEGVRFQTRTSDRENIAGAAQLASLALLVGNKKPGDLHWHGGEDAFAWIAEDNSLVAMDAPTMIAFAQAVAAHKRDCIFIGRAIKDAADTAFAAEDRDALDAIDPMAGWPD